MRGFRLVSTIAMLALFLWVGIGCSNPDNVNTPDVPNINDNIPGDVLDPQIPPSFVLPEAEGGELGLSIMYDLAFEKDGDLVISTPTGVQLFDPFAQWKRDISRTPPGESPWDGLVDAGPGLNDTGRAMIVTGPPIACSWISFYDDANVTGGSPMADCPS